MKMCGHREDAEDTAQDVLLASLPHLHKLGTPDELAAWLYTVTRNRCRRKRRNPQEAPGKMISLEDLMPSRDELEFLLQAGAPGADASVLQAEEQQRLHEAILQLPVALRLVLVLHDMEELTAAEVARILALKEGTVRVRLHRARLAVRQHWMRKMRGEAAPEGKKPASASRRSKDCCKIFAGLSAYLDGTMPALQCEVLRKHMEACPACVAFLQNLGEAIERCRRLPAACDAAARAAMHRLLLQEYQRMIAAPHAATARPIR